MGFFPSVFILSCISASMRNVGLVVWADAGNMGGPAGLAFTNLQGPCYAYKLPSITVSEATF